ncbi:MAG: hypothetical protein LBR47_01490 [Spirochaetaceae bacterium]|nr:hypothetical protein [Spirochaetaceae bacterium]
MKGKAVFPVLGSLFLIFLVSCVSSPKGFKNAETLLPVGIVAVTADDRILWYGDEEDTGAGLFDALFDKDDGEVDDPRSQAEFLVSASEQVLFESLKNRNVSFVDGEAMLASGPYSAGEISRVRNWSSIVYPENYKYFMHSDKDLIRALASETGMKSAAFVHFSFYTDISAGIAKTGSMYGFVTMEVNLTDSEGKRIANRTYTAKTDETMPVKGGLYDTRELLELFPSALNAVCGDFVSDFLR